MILPDGTLSMNNGCRDGDSGCMTDRDHKLSQTPGTMRMRTTLSVFIQHSVTESNWIDLQTMNMDLHGAMHCGDCGYDPYLSLMC